MAQDHESSSQVEALKSTSIIGGSTAIVMVVRIVRTKVLALLLGPAGVGLEGIYDSALNLARTLVDLGISSAGVRQIAVAFSSGDHAVIATTVATLRRVCLVLGLMGTVVLFLTRESVSFAAFGTIDHARDIGVLSITLLIGAIAGGKGVLLTGARRIGDLAKMNVIGVVAGACISIPIVYVWGRQGIVAYMVAGTVVASLTAWHFARRVQIEPVQVSFRDVAREAASLLKLGLVFVATGLMSTGALFLLRAFVTRQQGLPGAGQFQAASALSTIYVGFVLQAMGTDFYPRLAAVAEDNRRCNQLVNEQAELSILMALPGVLATLAAAPWVIRIFYSAKFNMAAEVLCWQITGMFLQVNSWPMGFIVVAKGRAAALFWTDLASYSLYVALGWLGLKWFGLPGAGMAFLGLYLFHWGLIYAVVRKVSGFRWTAVNLQLSISGTVAIAITLAARLGLPEPWPTLLGSVLALIAGVWCLKKLVRMIGVEKIERRLAKFGLAPLFRVCWRIKLTPGY
jgi:enterobacterial common antigen flippase